MELKVNKKTSDLKRYDTGVTSSKELADYFCQKNNVNSCKHVAYFIVNTYLNGISFKRSKILEEHIGAKKIYR